MFNSLGGGVPLGGSPWNFQWTSMNGQGTQYRRNTAESLKCLSRAYERYRQTTDRQTTDGRATVNSEGEREFTFANYIKHCCINTAYTISISIRKHKISWLHFIIRCFFFVLFCYKQKQIQVQHWARKHLIFNYQTKHQLECGPMPNAMATLPNIGGALWSTLQSLADVHCWSTVQ